MWRALLLSTIVLLAGCTESLPALYDTGGDVGRPPDQALIETVPSADLSPDGWFDAGPDGATDLGPDAAPPLPGLFDCSEPQALTNIATVTPREPALSADGLSLFVKDSKSAGYLVAQRPSHADPFGAWGPAPAWIASSYQDMAFYDDGAEERFFAAISVGGGRVIIDCAAGASCDATAALSLTVPAGVDALDFDGPDIAWLPSEPLLVFNAGPDSNNHRVFISRQVGGVWQPAEALPAVPDSSNDDPAISPDGRIVLFSFYGAASGEVWIIRRASTAEPFGEPTPLAAPINGAGSNSSPDLAVYPPQPDALELVFISTRNGGAQVMRSVCSTIDG